MINHRSAPNEFVYELPVPDNGRITETSEGGVAVLDADQNAVAYIAPAWAKNASGADAPTHHVVGDTTITQVVDTSGIESRNPQQWPGLRAARGRMTAAAQAWAAMRSLLSVN